VLDFVKGHVFDPADFVIRTDGVCRLNPEMARVVVATVPRGALTSRWQ
jgi:CRISP-associated protein Cas1